MKFGLTNQRLQQIQDVLATCPQIEEVLIFGSRAKGNFRPGSDIDLVFKGTELEDIHLDRLFDKLDDLLLPVRFDLLLFQELEHEDLLDHIARVGQVFYKKQPELAEV